MNMTRQEMPPSIESSLATHGLADEQRGLLDLIDKLQFAQLDNVRLPQIVVVGDQSAGKSSVLEALSGTPFPRDAGACTRHATEIRLRRSREAKLRVSIIPDKTRPMGDQEKLLAFGGSVRGDQPFESLMRDATELIAPRSAGGRFAARDILVVEKSGPDMPLLTLVDLPGLVRVANRDQSDADIQTIEALSNHYMKSSRTIILAVVGGNNDYVQAPILKKARQYDPRGSRTIGVLTKPDLAQSIGLEDKFIELVSNKDRENHFRLGWYVLLNPGPGESASAENRERREADFFSQGKWAALPSDMLGVGPLRQKLSTQLQRHIGRHVQSLRRQIQQSLERCDTQLKQLGPGHDTVEGMRFELGELFTACNALVTPAVHGNYKNPFGDRFFSRQTSASAPKNTPPQKLRARVRDESDRYARRFRQRGVSTPDGGALPAAGVIGDPAKKSFAVNQVERLLSQIRGNELPLDANPRAPYILFQDFARSWGDQAQDYLQNVGVIANEFLADVVGHVVPLRMQEPLRRRFLEAKVQDCMRSAQDELARLTDDLELEIQPFDPEYEDRLRAWRAAASAEGEHYTEADEVLEKALIYYDLTSRVYLRNIITQVVERHLLLGLLRLFNPVEILRMSDAAVEGIAAENKQTRDRRQALTAQRKAIEEARNICVGLAMRSDLRGSDDDDDGDENYDTEDDEAGQLRHSLSQRQSRPYASSSSPDSSRRPVRPHVAVDTDGRPRATQRDSFQQQQQPTSAASYRPSSAAYDYTNGNGQNAPTHTPPPPPRPSKVGFEDPDRFYDATPRTEATGQPAARPKDSARQRLASAMRLGAQQ